jgi:hypothetical protein
MGFTGYADGIIEVIETIQARSVLLCFLQPEAGDGVNPYYR